MKRIGLFVYTAVLFIIGFMLIPLIMVSCIVTKEYSRARIRVIEQFLTYMQEYRYRILQLTTKEDNIGYYALINIDSIISELEELLYETKQGTELVQCA